MRHRSVSLAPVGLETRCQDEQSDSADRDSRKTTEGVIVVGFHARKRVRIGPFVLYFAFPPPRMTSWGIKVGKFTWNAKTRRKTYDTPGPGSYSWGERASRKP